MKPRIDAEAYAKAWEDATSVKEVAKKFGLTEQAARMKACYFRRKGVPLKYMRPETNWKDVKKSVMG